MKNTINLSVLCSFLISLLTLPAFAEDDLPQRFELSDKASKKVFSIDYSGFVRWDGIFSTRQPVSAREGFLNFYPQPVKLNAEGKDENADPLLNMLAFFTRGAVKFSAPPVLGHDVSAYVEADFFGHLNSTISNFRLRHAFVRFDTPTTRLILGQYWSIFTEHEFFPGVINPGAGQPLQPFARHPGIYHEWKPSEAFRLRSGLSMQRDAFAEFGAKNELQQRSGLPAAAVSALWSPVSELKLGSSIMAKAIRPAPAEDNIYSGALQIFGESKPFSSLRLRFRGVAGTDLADHQMLGGFALTQDNEYVNLLSASGWGDIDYRFNKEWRAGFVTGGTLNGGALADVGLPESFVARSPSLSQAIFFIPRIVYQPATYLRFSFEASMSMAKYASEYSANLAPRVTSEDKWLPNLHLGLTSMFIF